MHYQTILLGVLALVGMASCSFDESLYLKPLPRNKLQASWDFKVTSEPQTLDFFTPSAHHNKEGDHFKDFPRALGPIIQTTNTRELHLRFTQGWYDLDSWGRLPKNGSISGGTGVELWAIVEAENVEAARASWTKLTNSLSGFFCASLNFIDDSITTFPKHMAQQQLGKNIPVLVEGNSLYLLRASLPSEPICTENLTPFLKLIPSRGKAGISSLLEGHKLFDSLWQGMAIDVHTEQNEAGEYFYSMDQSVNSIIDVVRSIRKREHGGIPKPTPGDDLRCDKSKINSIWQCFPLSESTEVSWNLEKILGRKIKGPGLLHRPSRVVIDVDPSWEISVSKASPLANSGEFLLVSHVIDRSNDNGNLIIYDVDEAVEYDFTFESEDSTKVSEVQDPPLKVARSLSGYSQGEGGFRVALSNPSASTVEFVYYEVLPWYMRPYLNTLSVDVKSDTNSSTQAEDYIKSRYYKPAIDRARPSHLEFTFELPPFTNMTLGYEFDKSLLLYAEYPPDANHGFAVDPAIVSVLDPVTKETIYEMRTTSSLVTLPTPDFSMPYNVIILTSTIFALVFGSVFNLLIRRVVTEAEAEKLAQKSKLTLLVERVTGALQVLKKKKTTKTE